MCIWKIMFIFLWKIHNIFVIHFQTDIINYARQYLSRYYIIPIFGQGYFSILMFEKWAICNDNPSIDEFVIVLNLHSIMASAI